MSISLMTEVWGMSIPATPKLVLLSLADQANDFGVCWPSQPQIALRCSITDRAVRDQLAWLESKKAIRRDVRKGIGTTFTLTLKACAEPRNVLPATPEQSSAVTPQKTDEPRNNVPATPEQSSGHPGTPFRQIISKHQESSVDACETKKPSRFDAKSFLIDQGVSEQVTSDWLDLRKAKKAIPTKTALNGMQREADNAGMSLSNVLELCCERGWQGFKADWIKDRQQSPTGRNGERSSMFEGGV